MSTAPEIPAGYLRVTDVLKPFSTLHLLDKQMVDRAADRGTRAHKFCELYALNLLVMEPDEDCKFYVEGFIKWFDIMVSEVVMSEKRINSEKYKLSGAFDFLVRINGDKGLTLMDLKTPQSKSISWQLQTAAYRMLIQDELCVEVERRAVLMLPKEQGYASFLEYTDHQEDERKYLNALELYRFFNG